jgi:hypothetical protein
LVKFVVMVLCLYISDANACRFSPAYPPEAVGALSSGAALVVEATLISPTTKTSGRFAVHQWLKGNGGGEIEISGFGQGTDCRSPMYHGRYIVFFSKRPDGSYWLAESATYAGMRPATKENVEAVIAAVAAGRTQFNAKE